MLATIQATGFQLDFTTREQPAHGQRLQPSLAIPLLYAVYRDQMMGRDIRERRP
jgi:hypothetical protein